MRGGREGACGDGSVLSRDCIGGSITVAKLYYDLARGYHWGKWVNVPGLFPHYF